MRFRTDQLVAPCGVCLAFLAVLFLSLPTAAESAPPPPPPQPLIAQTTNSAESPTRSTRSPFRTYPRTAGDACPVATPVQCNSVIEKWRNDAGNVWDSYACLDKKILANLPFSETHYAITIDQPNVDLSVAIPETTTGMNVFAALLNECDNDDCAGASHVISQTILQHAIAQNAAQNTYDLVIDSNNLVGTGDAVVACGSYETGWCQNVVSQSISCRNQRIADTTAGKPDNITNYGLTLAFDGPEITYRLLVTETSYVSTTVFYSGSPALKYNNYMSSFLLGSACNQRDLLLFSGLAGETGSTTASLGRWLEPGTYYLVVDGMHLPSGGDAFELDIACEAPPVTVDVVDLSGAPQFVGEEVEVVIRMRNQAQLRDWLPLLDGPELRHTLPPELQLVSNSLAISPAGTLSKNTEIVASWPSISPTKSVEIRYRAIVKDSARNGPVELNATWQAFGRRTGESSVQIGPAQDPLSVRKESAGGNRPLQIGDTIFYTITVTNQNSHTVSGFTLTDTLPLEVALMGGTVTPPGVAGSGRLVWGAQTIGAQTTLQYTYAVRVSSLPANGLLENQVRLAQPGRAVTGNITSFHPPLERKLHLPAIVSP